MICEWKKRLFRTRKANRVQLSGDALNTYVDDVEKTFGTDVDYKQAVKFYDAKPIGLGHYCWFTILGWLKTIIIDSKIKLITKTDYLVVAAGILTAVAVITIYFVIPLIR